MTDANRLPGVPAPRDADGRRVSSVLICLGCGVQFPTGQAIVAHFPFCTLWLRRPFSRASPARARELLADLAADGPVVMPPMFPRRDAFSDVGDMDAGPDAIVARARRRIELARRGSLPPRA